MRLILDDSCQFVSGGNADVEEQNVGLDDLYHAMANSDPRTQGRMVNGVWVPEPQDSGHWEDGVWVIHE